MTGDLQQNVHTFSVARLCASYCGGENFFAKFRAVARQFEGVDDVVVLAAGEQKSVQRPGTVFASAPIYFMREKAGELHVFIHIEAFRNSSPMPITRFLAKQLEVALQSAAIHASHAALQKYLGVLEAQVEERKLIERARGVIESRRLIPKGEGERLLKKLSDQSGRNLRDVANGIVATANRNPWKSAASSGLDLSHR